MDEIHPTRLHIFQTIESIARELGVEAVTFPEVSKRVFLQPSSITYYFPSKDDMLDGFIRWALKESELPADSPSSSAQKDSERICELVDHFANAGPYRDPVIRAIVRFALNGSDRSSLFSLRRTTSSSRPSAPFSIPFPCSEARPPLLPTAGTPPCLSSMSLCWGSRSWAFLIFPPPASRQSHRPWPSVPSGLY